MIRLLITFQSLREEVKAALKVNLLVFLRQTNLNKQCVAEERNSKI